MEEMSDEQRRVLDDILKGPRGTLKGPLRAILHRAELADRWQHLGEILRYRTSLPPRLSELAILVTARALDAQFEWFAHEPPAREAGLAESVIAALRVGDEPTGLNEDEAAVYHYCHELHRDHVVSDASYARALERFGTVGVVELTALAGYYTMVAMTLNAHRIPLPPGVEPPLPPRRRT
jgi:4-carboxymuconolactone decarboxylase